MILYLLVSILPTVLVLALAGALVFVARSLILRFEGRPNTQMAVTFLAFGPLAASILLGLILLAGTFLSPSGLTYLRAETWPALAAGWSSGLILALALIAGYWLGALPALATALFAALTSRRIRADLPWLALVTLFGAGLGVTPFLLFPGAQDAPPALFAALAGAGGVSAALCAALSLKRRPRAAIAAA